MKKACRGLCIDIRHVYRVELYISLPHRLPGTPTLLPGTPTPVPLHSLDSHSTPTPLPLYSQFTPTRFHWE